MQSLNDDKLRQLAHKRVEFRNHLIVYFVVNGMLWVIWWLSGHGYPWPIWPMCGWGIGVIFQYIFDYRSSRLLSEEEEFNRLKKKAEEENKY